MFRVIALLGVALSLSAAAAYGQEKTDSYGPTMHLDSARVAGLKKALYDGKAEQRAKTAKPQTAAQKAHTDSAFKALQAKIESLGIAKKEDTVKTKEGSTAK